VCATELATTPLCTTALAIQASSFLSAPHQSRKLSPAALPPIEPPRDSIVAPQNSAPAETLAARITSLDPLVTPLGPETVFLTPREEVDYAHLRTEFVAEFATAFQDTPAKILLLCSETTHPRPPPPLLPWCPAESTPLYRATTAALPLAVATNSAAQLPAEMSATIHLSTLVCKIKKVRLVSAEFAADFATRNVTTIVTILALEHPVVW